MLHLLQVKYLLPLVFLLHFNKKLHYTWFPFARICNLVADLNDMFLFVVLSRLAVVDFISKGLGGFVLVY
jgi:hypothetical protein